MQISSLLAGKKVQTIDPDVTIEVLCQALSVLKIGALVVSNNGKKNHGNSF